VGESVRCEVVERLVRTALVDDRRYAETRASTLADRGAGNDRIRHELAFAGVEDEPCGRGDRVARERSRACAADRRSARRERRRRPAIWPAKGYSEDVISGTVVADSLDEPIGMSELFHSVCFFLHARAF
jgi:SOS response regulatory protein OraA/RecX